MSTISGRLRLWYGGNFWRVVGLVTAIGLLAALPYFWAVKQLGLARPAEMALYYAFIGAASLVGAVYDSRLRDSGG